MDYRDFIAKKADVRVFDGIKDDDFAEHLFPHQRDLVRWALRKGRSAVFADTGLGKTAIQIEWARHVSRRGRVLILAPLAVAQQTVAEGASFGVDMAYRREDTGDLITVTNYEMMDRFDLSAFTGVVLDESSILKSFNGATRNAIMGIGSEGYVSLQMGRRFIGAELKRSYFDQAVRNLSSVSMGSEAQPSLFT